MPRPTDWNAIGLSGDPTPGDPEQIRTLSTELKNLGTSAREISTAIDAVMNTAGDSVFVGEAADALRGKVDDRLRHHIEDVAQSFESASTSLSGWADKLVELQSRADGALNSGRGLSEDDPQRETYATTARQAGTEHGEGASSAAGAIRGVSNIQLPISECQLFWEAFQWLAIILIIPALIFGGPIALLALGVNLTLFVKTIVDFAKGDASFLDLFLAGLGILAPTTKALPIFQIIKAGGTAFAKGFTQIARGTFQALRNLFTNGFRLTTIMPSLQDFVRLSSTWVRQGGLWVMQGIHNLPALTGMVFQRGGLTVLENLRALPGVVRGLPATFGRGVVAGWNGLGRGLVTAWHGVGTGAKATWDFTVRELGGTKWTRLLLPVDAGEIGQYGWRGALRIGLFDRGVMGNHIFGAPLGGAIGHGVSAVPMPHGPHGVDGLVDMPRIELGNVRLGDWAGTHAGLRPFELHMGPIDMASALRPPSLHMGDVGAIGDRAGLGFHASRQLDALVDIPKAHLNNLRLDGFSPLPARADGGLGVSAVTSAPTLHPSGLYLPGAAGSPAAHGVDLAAGAPVTGGTHSALTAVQAPPPGTAAHADALLPGGPGGTHAPGSIALTGTHMTSPGTGAAGNLLTPGAPGTGPGALHTALTGTQAPPPGTTAQDLVASITPGGPATGAHPPVTTIGQLHHGGPGTTGTTAFDLLATGGRGTPNTPVPAGAGAGLGDRTTSALTAHQTSLHLDELVHSPGSPRPNAAPDRFAPGSHGAGALPPGNTPRSALDLVDAGTGVRPAETHAFAGAPGKSADDAGHAFAGAPASKGDHPLLPAAAQDLHGTPVRPGPGGRGPHTPESTPHTVTDPAPGSAGAGKPPTPVAGGGHVLSRDADLLHEVNIKLRKMGHEATTPGALNASREALENARGAGFTKVDIRAQADQLAVHIAGPERGRLPGGVRHTDLTHDAPAVPGAGGHHAPPVPPRPESGLLAGLDDMFLDDTGVPMRSHVDMVDIDDTGAPMRSHFDMDDDSVPGSPVGQGGTEDLDGFSEFVDLIRPLRQHVERAFDNPAADIEVAILANPGGRTWREFSDDVGHAMVSVMLPGERAPLTIGFYPSDGLFGHPGAIVDDAGYVLSGHVRVLGTYRITAAQLFDGYRYAMAHSGAVYDLFRYNCVRFAEGFVSAAVGKSVADLWVAAPYRLVDTMLRRDGAWHWADGPSPVVDLTAGDLARYRAADAYLKNGSVVPPEQFQNAFVKARQWVLFDHQRPLIVGETKTPLQVDQLDLLSRFETMVTHAVVTGGDDAGRQLSRELGTSYGTLRPGLADLPAPSAGAPAAGDALSGIGRGGADGLPQPASLPGAPAAGDSLGSVPSPGAYDAPSPPTSTRTSTMSGTSGTSDVDLVLHQIDDMLHDMGVFRTSVDDLSTGTPSVSHGSGVHDGGLGGMPDVHPSGSQANAHGGTGGDVHAAPGRQPGAPGGAGHGGPGIDLHGVGGDDFMRFVEDARPVRQHVENAIGDSRADIRLVIGMDRETGSPSLSVWLPGRHEPVTLGPGASGELGAVRGGVDGIHGNGVLVLADHQITAAQLGSAYRYALENLPTWRADAGRFTEEFMTSALDARPVSAESSAGTAGHGVVDDLTDSPAPSVDKGKGRAPDHTPDTTGSWPGDGGAHGDAARNSAAIDAGAAVTDARRGVIDARIVRDDLQARYEQGVGTSAEADGVRYLESWEQVRQADTALARAEAHWSEVTGGAPLPEVRSHGGYGLGGGAPHQPGDLHPSGGTHPATAGDDLATAGSSAPHQPTPLPAVDNRSVVGIPGQDGLVVRAERGRTPELVGNAEVGGHRFEVADVQRGGAQFTVRQLDAGGSVVHSWTYKRLGPQLRTAQETTALSDGHFGGATVTIANNAVEDVRAGGSAWPAKLGPDGEIIVASPLGNQVYDRAGGVLIRTETSGRPPVAPPGHVPPAEAGNWTAATDLARTHLGKAAVDNDLKLFMQNVIGGAFTSKKGYGGYINAGVLEADPGLIGKVEEFNKVTKGLLHEGANEPMTVWRGVAMDPHAAQADVFIERLPASTSNNRAFQAEWAKNGVNSNRVVFEIEVPANHGKLAMAYPPGYEKAFDDAVALSDQSEVTLSPTRLVRTGSPRVEPDGITVIPVRAEQIPNAELPALLREEWQGLPSGTAFDDFGRAFEQGSMRRWEGLDDAVVRTEGTDPLVKTFVVSRPGFTDELTVTVTHEPGRNAVSVRIEGGDRAFSREWSSTGFSNVAADLRGNVLHNNDLFNPLPTPASWKEAPTAGPVRAELSRETDLFHTVNLRLRKLGEGAVSRDEFLHAYHSVQDRLGSIEGRLTVRALSEDVTAQLLGHEFPRVRGGMHTTTSTGDDLAPGAPSGSGSHQPPAPPAAHTPVDLAPLNNALEGHAGATSRLRQFENDLAQLSDESSKLPDAQAKVTEALGNEQTAKAVLDGAVDDLIHSRNLTQVELNSLVDRLAGSSYVDQALRLRTHGDDLDRFARTPEGAGRPDQGVWTGPEITAQSDAVRARVAGLEDALKPGSTATHGEIQGLADELRESAGRLGVMTDGFVKDAAGLGGAYALRARNKALVAAVDHYVKLVDDALVAALPGEELRLARPFDVDKAARGLSGAAVDVARRYRVWGAYKDIPTGKQWTKVLPDAEGKWAQVIGDFPDNLTPTQKGEFVKNLSGRNVQGLRQEFDTLLGTLDAGDAQALRDLRARVENLPHHIKHATPAYHTMANSGFMMSQGELERRGLKFLASGKSSVKNTSNLGNDDFVFFRMESGKAPMQTRYGPTTMIFDAKVLQEKGGWVSLHDQLNPLDRPTMRNLEFEGKNVRAAEFDEGFTGTGERARWTYTYPDKSTRTVSFEQEVFHGADVRDGLALSVVREVHSIGGDFKAHVLRVMNNEDELGKVVSNLFRPEAKFGGNLPFTPLGSEVSGRWAGLVDVHNPAGDGRYFPDGTVDPIARAAGKQHDEALDRVRQADNGITSGHTNSVRFNLRKAETHAQQSVDLTDQFRRTATGDRLEMAEKLFAERTKLLDDIKARLAPAQEAPAHSPLQDHQKPAHPATDDAQNPGPSVRRKPVPKPKPGSSTQPAPAALPPELDRAISHALPGATADMRQVIKVLTENDGRVSFEQFNGSSIQRAFGIGRNKVNEAVKAMPQHAYQHAGAKVIALSDDARALFLPQKAVPDLPGTSPASSALDAAPEAPVPHTGGSGLPHTPAPVEASGSGALSHRAPALSDDVLHGGTDAGTFLPPKALDDALTPVGPEAGLNGGGVDAFPSPHALDGVTSRPNLVDELLAGPGNGPGRHVEPDVNLNGGGVDAFPPSHALDDIPSRPGVIDDLVVSPESRPGRHAGADLGLGGDELAGVKPHDALPPSTSHGGGPTEAPRETGVDATRTVPQPETTPHVEDTAHTGAADGTRATGRPAHPDLLDPAVYRDRTATPRGIRGQSQIQHVDRSMTALRGVAETDFAGRATALDNVVTAADRFLRDRPGSERAVGVRALRDQARAEADAYRVLDAFHGGGTTPLGTEGLRDLAGRADALLSGTDLRASTRGRLDALLTRIDETFTAAPPAPVTGHAGGGAEPWASDYRAVEDLLGGEGNAARQHWADLTSARTDLGRAEDGFRGGDASTSQGLSAIDEHVQGEVLAARDRLAASYHQLRGEGLDPHAVDQRMRGINERAAVERGAINAAGGGDPLPERVPVSTTSTPLSDSGHAGSNGFTVQEQTWADGSVTHQVVDRHLTPDPDRTVTVRQGGGFDVRHTPSDVVVTYNHAGARIADDLPLLGSDGRPTGARLHVDLAGRGGPQAVTAVDGHGQALHAALLDDGHVRLTDTGTGVTTRVTVRGHHVDQGLQLTGGNGAPADTDRVLMTGGAGHHVTDLNGNRLPDTVTDLGPGNGFRVTDHTTGVFAAHGVDGRLGETGVALADAQGVRGVLFVADRPGGHVLTDAAGAVRGDRLTVLPGNAGFRVTDDATGATTRYGADGRPVETGVALADAQGGRGGLFVADRPGGHVLTDAAGAVRGDRLTVLPGNAGFRVTDDATGATTRYGADGRPVETGVVLVDPATGARGDRIAVPDLQGGHRLTDTGGAALNDAVTTLPGNQGLRIANPTGYDRFGPDGAVTGDGLRLTGRDGRPAGHVDRPAGGAAHWLDDTFTADPARVLTPRGNGDFEITLPGGGREVFDGTTGRFLGDRTPLPGGGHQVTAADGAFRRYDGAAVHTADGAPLPGEPGGRVIVTQQPTAAAPQGARWLEDSAGNRLAHWDVTMGQNNVVRAGFNLPGTPRHGEFVEVSANGTLARQSFNVLDNGRATGFRYEVDHVAHTWQRTDATGNAVGTGSFHRGAVDRAGEANGRLRLLGSTKASVAVFERRPLPGGDVLDAFRRTDTIQFGRTNPRTTWARWDHGGEPLGSGTRHYDTAGTGWRDKDGLHTVREYRDGLQKYDGRAGHTLAERNADGTWTWHRYDGAAGELDHGPRTRDPHDSGWTDRTRGGAVVQRQWGMGRMPEHAGQYQEWTLTRDGTLPGTWERQSPHGKESGKHEVFGDGHLTTERWREQRPPSWVRNNWMRGAGRADAPYAHVLGDGTYQMFTWVRESPTRAGSGVRYVGMDGGIVDLAADGSFARSSTKLHNGTTLKVGDNVARPDLPGADPAHQPWSDGTRSGYRVPVADGRLWEDRVVAGGVVNGVAREGLPGGQVREYAAPRGLADPVGGGAWVTRDAHGNLTGLRHEDPAHPGTFVEGTGAVDSSRWAWRRTGLDGTVTTGRREFFRGSSDTRLPWDDSYRDFDAAGNLVRERRMLDSGRYVDAWRDPAPGGNGWLTAKFERDGTPVDPGAGRQVRTWWDGHAWQDQWTAGARHFRDELVPPPGQGGVQPAAVRLRETPVHSGGPLRVREFDTGAATAHSVWKEFDHGAVVRQRAVEGQGFLETDAWRGQWNRYDAGGRLVAQRTDNGLVFETDALGRMRLVGNEYDFRGTLTEIRGWGRRVREAQRMPWSGTALPEGPGAGAAALREARYEPYWQTVAYKAALEFGQEFILEFGANLAVNGIVAAVQNKPFTGKDALKAFANAAVGATVKTGLTTAIHENRGAIFQDLGSFKAGWANVDSGKHWNRRPGNHDKNWANEWGGNETPTRWRGGVYDFSFSAGSSVISGWINGSMNAAVWGVTNADGQTVKLSGADAFLDGGINALAALTTAASTALVKNVFVMGGGSRLFHRQGFADFWIQLPFKIFEKTIQSLYLTSAYRASINPSWFQVPPPAAGQNQ